MNCSGYNYTNTCYHYSYLKPRGLYIGKECSAHSRASLLPVYISWKRRALDQGLALYCYRSALQSFTLSHSGLLVLHSFTLWTQDKSCNSNSRNLRLGVWVCVNINATWCANIQVYIVWYLLEEYWLYCCILHLTILEEYLHWNKGRLSQERKPRIVIYLYIYWELLCLFYCCCLYLYPFILWIIHARYCCKVLSVLIINIMQTVVV